jgi:hypothetical protein
MASHSRILHDTDYGLPDQAGVGAMATCRLAELRWVLLGGASVWSRVRVRDDRLWKCLDWVGGVSESGVGARVKVLSLDQCSPVDRG